jgi:diketogulonate reductase-like aldo/keto reductase
MASNQITFKLNTGAFIPAVGLGTWKSKPGEVGEAVRQALLAGYRHIDCALVYGNEKEIGAVLTEFFSNPNSGVKREDVFITSKLWNTYHHKDDVIKGITKTLQDLNVDYVDLYQMHWPIAMPYTEGVNIPLHKDGRRIVIDYPLTETWAALEDVYRSGKAKAIGVSNFNQERLELLLKNGSVVPAVNQVELHPLLTQQPLVDFCASKGIHVTAYSPLGTPDSPFRRGDAPSLLADETINAIAAKYNKGAGQVLIRWAIQRGTSVLPKSVNVDRIKQNIDVFDFELSTEEVALLSRKNKDFRMGLINWIIDPFGPLNQTFPTYD